MKEDLAKNINFSPAVIGAVLILGSGDGAGDGGNSSGFVRLTDATGVKTGVDWPSSERGCGSGCALIELYRT